MDSTKRAMVVINGRFLTSPITGVQRYAIELCNSLDNLITENTINCNNIEIHCLVPKNTKIIPAWKAIKIIKAGMFSGNLWEQIDLPLYARNHLLFSPANIGPYFYKKQVVTIHDPSVFAFPSAYSLPFKMKYRTILKKLGKTSLSVLTVSEFSKGELQRWCGIPGEKIEVIYEGSEHILNKPADENIFSRFGIGKSPFFLAVGSNSPHKNFSAVAKAFEKANFKDINFVITGGDFSKVFHTKNQEFPNSFIRTGYINDRELRALYNHAVGLVYPSLYEGFGLPPLEAMACGCPVICSNAASLPEVCGDAALYCEPTNISNITEQMQGLINNPTLQSRLKEKGVIRAHQFSWRDAAEKTWKIIEEAHSLIAFP